MSHVLVGLSGTSFVIALVSYLRAKPDAERSGTTRFAKQLGSSVERTATGRARKGIKASRKPKGAQKLATDEEAAEAAEARASNGASRCSTALVDEEIEAAAEELDSMEEEEEEEEEETEDWNDDVALDMVEDGTNGDHAPVGLGVERAEMQWEPESIKDALTDADRQALSRALDVGLGAAPLNALASTLASMPNSGTSVLTRPGTEVTSMGERRKKKSGRNKHK